MKESSYITWAKHHHRFTYNLASSGVAHPPIERIGFQIEDVDLSGDHVEGWPPLLERIARRYGVTPENVVLAQGTSMANHLVCALLLERGDNVLVEHPVYEPLHLLPRFFHAEVRFFERRSEDGYRIDVDAIRPLVDDRTRLLICSNLHNPSGKLAGRLELESLADLAESRRFHVLVDEVYLEWLHDEGETSAATLSPRFLTTCSLTKAYGLDALRAGWILADAGLAARIRRLIDLFYVFTPHPIERLAARALDHAGEILGSLKPRLAENRRRVADLVERHPCLSWVFPDAGTVAFIHLEGTSVDRLVARLEAYDTAVAPGIFFGAAEYFRLGFGMSTETLTEGLHRLEGALNDLL